MHTGSSTEADLRVGLLKTVLYDFTVKTPTPVGSLPSLPYSKPSFSAVPNPARLHWATQFLSHIDKTPQGGLLITLPNNFVKFFKYLLLLWVYLIGISLEKVKPQKYSTTCITYMKFFFFPNILEASEKSRGLWPPVLNTFNIISSLHWTYAPSSKPS